MGSSLESHAIRPMPGALVAAGLVGFLGGLALAGVVVGVGVPVGPALGNWWNLVFGALWVGGGAVIGALSWRATTLRFEADQLVVVRPTGWRRRIPWAHVWSVQAQSSTNEDGDVTARWLTVVVLRHPGLPVPEMPTAFGEFMAWQRAHFRTVRLGVAMGVKPVDANGRFGRMRLRTRDQALRELEARGFTVRG